MKYQVVLSDEGWQLIDKAIATFGRQHQIDKATEEASEVVTALLHHKNHGPSPETEEDAIKEIGNLWVCLYQMREIFGAEKIDASISATFEKLKAKIGEKTQEKGDGERIAGD